MPVSKPLYLDHAASTPVLPEAREAIDRAWQDALGNPSSAHAAGRKARRALDDARERVAACLHARPDEILWTSGATEANNLALFGLSGQAPARILASSIEHPSVAEPLAQLQSRGFTLDELPVTQAGLVEPPQAIAPETRLVVIMRVNHETGAIQNLAPWVATGIPVHCDAAQAVGKIPIDFQALGVASLALSGHKFGAPPGCGALLVRRELTLRPLLFGGPQQQGRRPGTEAVALAAGLAAALEIALKHLVDQPAHVARLRARFLERLRAEAGPITVNGPDPDAERLPHIVNVAFPGIAADALLMALDLAGLACSTGSACSSGSLLPSPVLRAMRVPPDVLRSAMRFSFRAQMTVEEIDAALAILIPTVRRLRARALG